MIKSEIKFKQIEDRIDAEYYKLEYLNIEKLLFASPVLAESVKISKLRKDPTKEPSRKFYYLEIDNIDLQTGEIWPQEFYGCKAPSRARKGVALGDIIISTVRPNRNAVGFITEELKDCICSTGFAALRSEKVLPGYLFAFLKSRYAINQIVRLTTAAMYPAVSEKDLSTIKIPIPSRPFQEKIGETVKKAYQKRRLANKKYKEAEELLEKELGLENLDLSTEKTYDAKFSEVEDRFNAEYFQPKYKRLIVRLKLTKPLREVCKIRDEKLDPTKKPSATIEYIELANINRSTGEIEDCEEFKHWQLPGRARMLVKTGDVLVSSLGGSLDKVGLVTGDCNNQVASTGFYVIYSDQFTPETLFLLFRNKVLQLQLTQNTRGAIMSAISGREFKNLLIPPILKSTQEKITDLIKEAFKLRKESRQLIRDAKRKVEEIIEEGGGK